MIFRGVAHAAWSGATGHENALPSRDREGPVETIGPPLPDGRGSDFRYFHRRILAS
jgi:hypothetical protein